MSAALLDDATLDQLATVLQAKLTKPRPAWQTSLLVAVAGALIIAATTAYFSLHNDITQLGTSLRTDMNNQGASLRSEIGSLRTDMNDLEANLRAEMQAGFRQVNATLLDHTDRLARLEQAAGLPRIDD